MPGEIGDKYTCANCGGEFERSISDEDALAEAEENGFLDLPENLVIVCDDCYEQMIAWKPPAVYVAEQKARWLR